jgi:hypothetical protein
VDDTGSGLAEKSGFADEHQFHLLAEGHRGFKADSFMSLMDELVMADQANGVVIILDTGKKFVNLMDKTRVSRFTKGTRAFVMKGGTLIFLAHVNKKPGLDGKPIYAGTSDLVDDIDCAYTLAAIPSQASATEKVVVFENIKRRGNVAQTAAFAYSTEQGIPYSELLASVRLVDETQVEPLRQAQQIKSDAEIIAAIEVAIRDGVNTKMKLAEVVAKRVGVSKRRAVQVIEHYTGDNPAEHRWTYTVRDRGAKVFVLLAVAGLKLS